jgi:hypothetical protein
LIILKIKKIKSNLVLINPNFSFVRFLFLLILTEMVGYLSKKPKLSFVDDPGKLYRQRRRATQAKGLETLDPKVEGPSKSPRESPPPSPKEDQPQSPPMGEQSQPQCKIELCTPEHR